MAKIRLNEPRLRRVAGVQLRPGLQNVSDDRMKAIAKHPIGKKLMDKGVIEEVKSKGPGRPSTDALVAEIAEVYDMDELKKYAQDNRKAVSEAAKAQMQKIEAAGK